MKNIIRGLVFCFILSHASLHAQEIEFYNPTKTYKANTRLTVIRNGDIDGDNITDLIIGGSDTIYVLKGNGNGRYVVLWKANIGSYNHMAIADLTNDGNLDLVFPISDNIGLLINNGNGTFGTLKTYLMGNGSDEVAVADFNHDNYLDVAVATEDDLDPHYRYMAVFINNKNGTLKSRVLYSVPYVPYDQEPSVGGFRVNTLDMNDDTYIDIIQPYEGKDSMLIYYNKGDGTFNAPIQYQIPPRVSTTNVRDLDHDGKLDLITIGQHDANVIDPVYMFGFYLQKSGGANENSTPSYLNPYGARYYGNAIVEDMNQDGAYDLTLPLEYYDSVNDILIDSISLFLNQGNLAFTVPTATFSVKATLPYSPISGQFNGDTLLDYAYVTEDSTVYLILQKNLLSTAVKSSLQSQTINIYPNPTSGLLNLRASSNKALQSVSVFDAMGRIVYREDDLNQVQEVQLSLVNLPKGLYLLQTEQSNGLYIMQHFVIE